MGYMTKLAAMEVSVPTAEAAAEPAADLAADPAGQTAPVPAADPAAGQVRPEKEPSSAPISLEAETDDAAARRAHEAAEARRKAEWETEQREKQAAEQARLNRLAAMSDEDVVAASTQRVRADTEKLTRRNMKDCVSEHIQGVCRQDPAFARKAMHPRKSMMRCFWYINRKAKEYVQDEMKASGVQAENGVYGSDVPDDLVYQWAVDYFNDPEAQEDKEKEEKFVPRPYAAKSSKAKAASKPRKDPVKKAAVKFQTQTDVDGQLSFMGVAG